MKKIFEAYRANKIYFYLLLGIYSEVISAFCTGFFTSVLSAEIPAPGDAGWITELSSLGNYIFISILTVGAVLLLIPLVRLTIKAIKSKMQKMQILAMWGCAAAACVLGFVLAWNNLSFVGRIPGSLMDFLGDKIDMFVTSYSPLM